MKNMKFRTFAVILAASMMIPSVAFADDTLTNGLQYNKDNPNWQQYNSGKTGGAGWEDSTTDSDGKEAINTDGQVQLEIDTTGGTWQDPGKDPGDDNTDPNDPDDPAVKDNTNHDNGTFIVTIPTKIAYHNVKLGKFHSDDTYSCNVRGAIAEGKLVKVTANTDQKVTNGSKKNEVKAKTYTATTAGTALTTAGEYSDANFRTFTSEELYGGTNYDGSMKGTDFEDRITMDGTITTSGVYTGAIQYTASVIDQKL